MSANVPAESTAPGPITAGTVLGGRFEVEGLQTHDALGQHFRARDQKTRKPIAIHVLAAELASDKPAYDAVRDEIRIAAKLKHKGLAGIYGVGTYAGHEHFVAREWMSGQTLAELVVERKASGDLLSLRGIYNIVTHVCKALTAMHEVTCHGAVRPSVVCVTRTGRVKLSDIGLGLALIKARKWTLLPAEEQAFLAPEIKAGGLPDPRSDVFGVGALLYVLLTGRSPIDEFAAPSQVHPDASAELDAVLMRCLAGDPAQRFHSPDEIVQALLPLAACAPESPSDELGAEVEIDVDIAVSIAPPAPSSMQSAGVVLTNTGGSEPPMAHVPTAAPAAPAHAAQRNLPPNPLATAPRIAAPAAPAAPTASRPLHPAATGTAPQPAPPHVSPSPPQASTEDAIAEAMARLTKNDGPRWMAVKDGMDHGPFTARELIKLIVEGGILEEHSLFNMATNDRKKLADFPDFAPFVQQYKIRRDEQEHADALVRSSKVEKRSTAAKFVVLSGSVAALLVVGGWYFMSRESAEDAARRKDEDLAALYESGQVKISGTAGILKHTPRAGGARRSSGSSGGGFSSYEDAMNQAMELGDATKGGGERQLTSADVAGVMNRNLNKMFSCVSEELRGGRRLGGNVSMNIAILGSGKVVGASVNTGSSGFQRCIAAKVQQIHFPSFPAPRMGARYSFNVD